MAPQCSNSLSRSFLRGKRRRNASYRMWCLCTSLRHRMLHSFFISISRSIVSVSHRRRPASPPLSPFVFLSFFPPAEMQDSCGKKLCMYVCGGRVGGNTHKFSSLSNCHPLFLSVSLKPSIRASPSPTPGFGS